MTLREASVALGVKVRTLRWWISVGKIKAVKDNRQWIIPETEIDRVKGDTT